MDDVSIQTRRHYFVQAGYDWAIGGDKKYVLQPPSVRSRATGDLHPVGPQRHLPL
jgi:hypothetical protein